MPEASDTPAATQGALSRRRADSVIGQWIDVNRTSEPMQLRADPCRQPAALDGPVESDKFLT